MPHPVPGVLAAVDLGSNSFHMIVARYTHGQLVVVDRLREPVRLAAGLDEHGHLSRESTQRALQCLERFGQRLSDMQAESVRVVGTNTLRKARRRGAFMDRARDALGHPIEIISGVEEARLIYQGVAHTTPQEGGHRLVVDIGGGSTELIVGEGFAAKRLESLQRRQIAKVLAQHDPIAIRQRDRVLEMAPDRENRDHRAPVRKGRLHSDRPRHIAPRSPEDQLLALDHTHD